MRTESKSPSVVTAKEFQRHPGRYKRLAQASPLTITDNGEPSLVVMSVEEFRRLMRRDRRVLRAEELSDEDLEAIAKAEPTEESYRFAHEDPDL